VLFLIDHDAMKVYLGVEIQFRPAALLPRKEPLVPIG